MRCDKARAEDCRPAQRYHRQHHAERALPTGNRRPAFPPLQGVTNTDHRTRRPRPLTPSASLQQMGAGKQLPDRRGARYAAAEALATVQGQTQPQPWRVPPAKGRRCRRPRRSRIQRYAPRRGCERERGSDRQGAGGPRAPPASSVPCRGRSCRRSAPSDTIVGKSSLSMTLWREEPDRRPRRQPRRRAPESTIRLPVDGSRLRSRLLGRLHSVEPIARG